MTMSSCLSIPAERGETVRRSLIKRGMLATGLSIKSTDGRVILPIVKGKQKEAHDLFPDAELVVMEMETSKRDPRSYKDVIDIPDVTKEDLPSSYDIIGDVALIKVPESLVSFKKEIGEAMKRAHRNIRTVAMDHGVKGDHRIRDLEVICGQETLETLHIENNLRLKLDPSRVYFSPRLGHERERVASLIEKDERVLDMFAGVGPFSLNIARKGHPDCVIGIDINPDCIHYFEINIDLNSLRDTVEAVLGDSDDIAPSLGPFDRIVMNLPHSSLDHLEDAFLSMDRGFIHLYAMTEEKGIKGLMDRIEETAGYLDRKVSVQNSRVVHNYSPKEYMMVFDLKVDR